MPALFPDCHITLKKSHLLFFQEIRAMKT